MWYRATLLASLILFMNVSASYSQTTPFKKIMITVSDASTGLPVENAEVNFKGLIFKQKKKTDKLGIAIGEIYLASGAQTINVEVKNEIAGAGHKLYKSSVTLVAGQDWYNHAALLKPAYKKITISVVDDKNQPLSNAAVTFKGNPDETVNTTTSGVAIFNVPNTEESSMRSFSVKRDGYETFNMNLDINEPNSQIPTVAALKREATTVSSSFDMSKPVNTFLPPRTNTPTMLPDKFPESMKIPERKAGPFEPVCEPPLKGTEAPPSWAVTEEKDFLQYLSDACLKPINDLATAILSLASQHAEIAYEIPADKTSSSYILKTIDKAKSLYEKMKSFDPSKYTPKCLQTGVLLYSIGEYKNYLTVEGTINDVKALEKQLDDGIKTAEAKLAKNEELTILNSPIVSPSFWLQGWKILDGAGKTYQAIMSMLSKVVDPEVMMDYSVKALKALERANNMLNDLNTTCKVFEADEEIKDALAKGRQALVMAQVAFARWTKRQNATAAEIDDIVTKSYPDLTSWRSITDAKTLKPIWRHRQEWVDYGNKVKEAEKKIPEIKSLLRRIEYACFRFAPIVLSINDRIKQYLELADKGLKAADDCDFIKAEAILKQLKDIDMTECAIHYFPRSTNGGFPKSQELEMKITYNKSNPPCQNAKVNLPASLNVLHKKDLLWLTSLTLVKRGQGNSGEYKGTDVNKKEANATVTIDGVNITIEISVPSNGYYGIYRGKVVGNIAEGEYTPSSGFGPKAYFRAELKY